MWSGGGREAGVYVAASSRGEQYRLVVVIAAVRKIARIRAHTELRVIFVAVAVQRHARSAASHSESLVRIADGDASHLRFGRLDVERVHRQSREPSWHESRAVDATDGRYHVAGR